MMVLAAMALAGCVAVAPDSDWIRAGDLAGAFPQMSALAADAPIAPAAAPAAVRVFRPAELQRIAAKYGLPGAPEHEICAARRVASPDADSAKAAMLRAIPDAHIEVLEISRQPAPEGTIEFSPSGLQPVNNQAAGAIWRGWVRYGVGHKFSIWARVRVTVRVRRVAAKTDIPAGRPIAPEEIVVAETDETPGPITAGAFAEAIEDVAAKAARQELRAGQIIRRAWLEPAKVIHPGELVKVTVTSGNAELNLDGVAETPGAIGDMIFVRNQDSHQRFRAKVEGKGLVSVKR